jgi:hypothetical protein
MEIASRANYKNKGRERVACVLMEFALEGDHGKTLRTLSMRNSDGIAPGGTWDFAIDDARADGAKEISVRELRAC